MSIYNPVARLREKFFARRKARKASPQLKETLRKREPPASKLTTQLPKSPLP
jgi:hypothetical protein